VSFGVAYGLALQGLGLSVVNVNLLPLANVRQQVWSQKTRWFAAAAAVACAAGGLMFARSLLDNGALGDVAAANAAQAEVTAAKNFQSQISSKAADVGSLAKNMLGAIEDREIWPYLVHDAVASVATGNSSDVLDDDFSDLSKPGKPSRSVTRLKNLSGTYKLSPQGERIVEVTMEIEFAGSDPTTQLGNTVCKWLEDNASREDAPYVIAKVSSNNNAITQLKVNADGMLASSAAAGTTPGGGPTGGDGSETETAASAPNLGGTNTGVGAGGAGRRRGGNETVQKRPGSGLGFGTADGSGGARPPTEEATDTGSAQGAGGGSGFQRQNRGAQGEGAIDLDKVAPIPARPMLYPPGSTVYVGKVTFEARLKGNVTAAAPAAEVQ